MNRVRNIYRRLINSLFSDVEVFFGLPFKWKIRGAFAIGCLYVALVIMLLIAFNPLQAAESHSGAVLCAGYFLLLIGIAVVILPVFIPSLQRYPLPVVIFSVLILMIAFNLLLRPIVESVDDFTLLALFTGILAITFGARLYGRVIKEVSSEKTRIDTEIRLAQKIQNDLLPVIDIHEEEFQAFGKTVNAQEIGGDFFDLVKISSGKIAFCVGDVSGHNIAAGLIMGIVKSSFRTELRYNDDLVSIAESLNKTVIDQRSRGMFVSFACGIIDFKRDEVEYVNAGHPPVFHIRKGKAGEILTKGVALGLTEKAHFKTLKRKILHDDFFVCYSDGIIELRNRSGEEFGYQRLQGLLNHLDPSEEPRSVYDGIMRGVGKFHPDKQRRDDITLLIIKIK